MENIQVQIKMQLTAENSVSDKHLYKQTVKKYVYIPIKHECIKFLGRLSVT